MQKITRPDTHKPVRQPVRHAARKPARPAPAKPVFHPAISRVTGDVDLTVPKGYRARVLLKLVSRVDGHRYYAWWAMAGRHDVESAAMQFKYNGEDMIQFDLPVGMPLSEELLTPYLTDFLAGEHNEPPDTPTVRG
jgi:hypothetical protein